MKTPKMVLERKLLKRSRYTSSVVLDSRFCRRHDLKPGDIVNIFDHPTERDILCIQVPTGRRKRTKKT